MTIIAVSTAQELMEALESANGGDRIELAAGDYGDFYFQKTAFDERVTITSADPDALATFSTINLNTVENLTIEHVFVDFQTTQETQNFENALKVSNSAHIKIDSVVFEGKLVEHPAYGGGPDDTELQPRARAASILNSQDVTFSNNEVSVFRSGINTTNVDGVTITGNHIHDIRSTAANGSNINDLVLTDNYFHDFSPYGGAASGDHADFVHYWTKDEQDGPNSNFYIADNYFAVGDNDGRDANVLGIYLDDNSKSIGFEDVLIENNVLHLGAALGIIVENGMDVLIRENTVLQSDGDERDAPGVKIGGVLTDNITIQDNILSEIDGVAIRGSNTLDLATANVTMFNNLQVQRFNPEADNYVGDLFVNALTVVGELDDFRAIPGTAAASVGARQLRPGDEKSLIAISVEEGSGLDTLNVTVSISDFLGGVSQEDLADMSVTWNFGDGTTTTGHDVTHVYAKTGGYEISAVMTAPDGSKISLTKTVEVKTPNGLDIRFETGIQDISDTENSIVFNGDVGLVNTTAGKVLQLQNADSNFKVAVGEELSNNAEYTFTFDFRYDGDSQSGSAIYFPGTAIVSFDNGEIKLVDKTNLGESIVIRPENLKLDDSSWHRVSYVFSQSTGTASLYIDGSMVGNVFGLEGIQASSIGGTLTVGSPFGKSFTGHLDNISFLRAALTEDDIDLLHGGTAVSLSDLEGISVVDTPAPTEDPVEEEKGEAATPTPIPAEDVQPTQAVTTPVETSVNVPAVAASAPAQLPSNDANVLPAVQDSEILQIQDIFSQGIELTWDDLYVVDSDGWLELRPFVEGGDNDASFLSSAVGFLVFEDQAGTTASQEEDGESEPSGNEFLEDVFSFGLG